jgi:hypothetical protein
VRENALTHALSRGSVGLRARCNLAEFFVTSYPLKPHSYTTSLQEVPLIFIELVPRWL